ncbi:alcohol dehydrogenase catalytic domain-containing protein, partial [Bradyrhizobium sp. NBAIM08]|nr:alcohol dehydrogenase catalytic domain-containing protein [Bradyrhizobium sp. NBAIM08]
MRAALVQTPGVVEVVDVADPSPAPDQVLLAVKECGICGTDLHLVDGELGTDRFPL